MKKVECVCLSQDDVKDAFKKKGYEVAMYSTGSIPHPFCCGCTEMKNDFDNNNINLNDVLSEYIGKEVFFVLACERDKWFPSDFVAFIR